MVRRILWIEGHPVEAVIFVFSLVLFLYASFIMTPWYHAEIGNAVAASLNARWQEIVLALFFIGTSLPGLIAPFNKKVPNVWLEWGTFGICLSFLFLTILRLLLYGPIPLTWLALIAISIASGVLRIYLRSHRH